MTREEKAIMYFKDMRKKFCEDYLLGIPKDSVAYKATMAEKEFYDTAIEALEQEPCGDVISRQDDRGVSLKSVKHVLYDVCLHEDNRALFSKLLDRVNKLRDWEEYLTIKQEPCEDAISRQAVLDAVDKVCRGSVEYRVIYDRCEELIKAIPSTEPNTRHCKDCKHFRKLPYHADTLGKCIHHGGFCPKGDWYCADFEMD